MSRYRWDYIKKSNGIDPDDPIDVKARMYVNYLNNDTYHNQELLQQIRMECQNLVVDGFGCTWSPVWESYLQAILVYFPHAIGFRFWEFFVDNARRNGLLPPLNSSELETLREQEERERRQENRAAIVDRFIESQPPETV